jgi:hypothetical protein
MNGALLLLQKNSWSLAGLARSLRAQGKAAEAELIEKRFEKASAKADFKLTSSAM